VTPASRSIWTLRGTYFDPSLDLTSVKYVPTWVESQSVVQLSVPIAKNYPLNFLNITTLVHLDFGFLARRPTLGIQWWIRLTPDWSNPCSANNIFQNDSPTWLPAYDGPWGVGFLTIRAWWCTLTWPAYICISLVSLDYHAVKDPQYLDVYNFTRHRYVTREVCRRGTGA